MDLEALIERARDNVQTAEQRIIMAPGDVEAAVETRRLYELSHSAGSLAAERRRMAELVEQKERRDAAIADHEAAEAKNTGQLDQLGADLAANRQNLATVVEDAITALTALWDTAAAYNAQLGDHAAALTAADMSASYEDGDIVVRFGTGGVASRGWDTRRVLLRGDVWHALDPVAVLQYAHNAARAGRQYVTVRSMDFLHVALDDVVTRPEPVQAPSSPWASLPPRGDWNAPVNTRDGLLYQDGTLVPYPKKKWNGNHWEIIEDPS